MLRILCLSLALGLAAPAAMAGPAALAEGRVTVTYVAPETFRDREFRRERSRVSALAEFDRWFAELGARYLPAGQSLQVEVLDIDLAGEFEPWRSGFHDVRFLRDITPPRIHLRYRLLQGGAVVRAGEERLTDMNYLSNPRGHGDGRRFVHDKLMLQGWFRKTFAAPQRQSRPDLSG
ncbi:DUF3016 domain-containing protein [Paracoccus sp. PS-1]|uniref:DUF3016 domain-containing protein n=1 Tax=unclassified Paracoccus (in: a-proteobacteria) TaxID=2688777 RepID=UPI0004AE6B99|nr:MULTISPECIES: DUF3016 domain-containing protein [unclassified Paracoccus (in: a-proteobacteria)]MDQ7263191.1 DUF3016 domain-containing protein [Paracoccus sp. PS1]